jgi:hypothetical protein
MNTALKLGDYVTVIGGTGNLGPGLALRWAKAGYKVIIGSRTAEKAQEIVDELNIELGEDLIQGMENQDAVAIADVCILTVNQQAHELALGSLKDELQGKLLIDATARLSFPDLTPPAPPAAAQLAQEILGDEVRVVGAFQNVAAAALRNNVDQAVNSDVLVCADNQDDAEIAMDLARAAGMRAFFVGGLEKSIVVEGLTSLLIAMNKRYKVHDGTLKLSGFPE